MASLTAYTQAGADDASEKGDGTFSTSGTYLDIRCNTNALSANYGCGGYRFQLNIPQGATINSAILNLNTTSIADDPNCTIYAHLTTDADDFDLIADIIDTINRPRTTASVAWSATDLGLSAWVTAPDLKTIVQEIVDQVGWASGGHIVFLFIASTANSTDRLQVNTYEDVNPPYLEVDYTPIVTGPSLESNPDPDNAIAFGDVTLGQTDTATLTLSEIGDAALVISDPVIGGLHRDDFEVVSPTFPITIADGGAAVDVTLRVAPYVAGARSASLTLTTNDPAQPTVSYPLTATGVAVSSYPAPSTMTRVVQIDWDHDETFDHALSDISSRVLRATWNEGFLAGQGDFAEPSTLELEILNEDGAWWQDNSAATFYGLLVMGLRIRVRRTYNSKTYTQWIGNIAAVSFDPVPYSGRPKSIRISAVGPEGQLLDEGYMPPLRTNARIDTVIEEVLERCLKLPYTSSGWILGYSTLGVNTRLRDVTQYISLDTAAETVAWAGAGTGTDSGNNAQSYLRQLTAAELGGRMFYDPRTGKMTFHGRRHDYRYPEIVWTVDGDDLVDPGAESVQYGANVINSVTIGYEQITSGAAGSVLWEIDSAIQIRGGERREITAQYRDPDNKTERCSGTDMLRPTAGTDYAAHDTATGGGAVRTGELSVMVTFGAESARLRLVNTGTQSLYVTTLQVRGTPLVSHDRREFTYSDPDSIALHGRRRLPNGGLDVPMVSAIDTIESYARNIVNRESGGRVDYGAIYVRPTVNGEALWHVLEYGIGARLRLNLSGDEWSEHDAEYVIGGLRHDDDAWANAYNVTIALWPAAALRGWKLGVSKLGIDTVLVL